MSLRAMTMANQIEHVSDLDPAKTYAEVPVDQDDPSKGTKRVASVGEGATRFFLKPLDVFLNAHIYDNASILSGKQDSSEIGIHTRVNQTNIAAVQHGLTGFSNFSDDKGQIAFKTKKAVINGRHYDVVDDSVMNCLGMRLIQELAVEIKRISEVSPDDAKKSD